MKGHYYISSFFWSTLSRGLNAILGFVTVPLLMGYFGKAEYGILTLATACNGYMHLLDLGMNTGAVKFFSQWKAQGRWDLIGKVARTNITFYMLVAAANILLLLALAFFGEGLFNITHAQFLQLRSCLFIIALFSVFSWEAAPFSQLIIANKNIDFTMQMACIQTLLKGILIAIVFIADLTLTQYFFWLTLIIALLVIPFARKCLKDNLIDDLKPGGQWKAFKAVLTFSLAIFALSVFQMTATQSRVLVLGMFGNDGATIAADFRILEVMPNLIIMLCGSFATIFLPHSSELVARKDQAGIEAFAYKWTKLTTILANVMCVPFIYSASEALSAYVGAENSYLAKWLVLWCLTVLVQVHTTPGNSLILAYGKTKLLVIVTGITCALSIAINIALCRTYGVGSAVTGYFVYVLVIVGLYYMAFYKKLLGLDRLKMFSSFLWPTLLSFAVLAAVSFIDIDISLFGGMKERWAYLSVCVLKSFVWFIPYAALLFLTGILKIDELKEA